MARDGYLYGDERPLAYWVQLTKITDDSFGRQQQQVRPMLMHLDLRGGEFSRTSSNRLADVFDWMTRAFRVRLDDLVDYALMIVPMRSDLQEQLSGADSITYQVLEDWPSMRERSFLWLPVAYDDTEKRYAWQK